LAWTENSLRRPNTNCGLKVSTPEFATSWYRLKPSTWMRIWLRAKATESTPCRISSASRIRSLLLISSTTSTRLAASIALRTSAALQFGDSFASFAWRHSTSGPASWGTSPQRASTSPRQALLTVSTRSRASAIRVISPWQGGVSSSWRWRRQPMTRPPPGSMLGQ